MTQEAVILPSDVVAPVAPKQIVVLKEGIEDEELQKAIDEADLPACSLKLPQKYLSVSQVNMYLRCPKSYEWRYVKGAISPPAIAMTEGSAIHKVLEMAHNEKRRSKQPAGLDAMLDAYHQYWQAEKSKCEYEDETDEEIVRRDEQFIRLYHKDFVPKIIPVAVEHTLLFPFTRFDIPVKGVIDLIDNGEEDELSTVVDHKVVGKTKSQGEVDGDMQLSLYTYAVGLPKARFDMFVKNKSPKIVTAKTLRRPRDILWVETIFAEVAQAIDKGVFPPCSPIEWACTKKFCGYYDRCRGKA